MHYYIDKEELLSFEYNGLSSSDFGIVITKINDLSGPERNIEIIEIDGRDDAVLDDKGNFKPFELVIECSIDSTNEDIKEVCRNIKKWLQSSYTYKKLIVSDDEEYYYEAIFNNKLEIEEVLEQLGEVELNFLCKPFKKHVSGNQKITLTSHKNIFNKYNTSKPNIKVIGSGNITININSQRLILESLEDEIEIDSEVMNAYKMVDGKMVLQNSKMYSDFPKLEPGQNNISWTGNVTRVEITPRWAVL